MAQLIPLTCAPNQTMTVTLSVNGAPLTLNLRLCYNTPAGFWAMDIADESNDPLVSSVPLLTGIWPGANILAPYNYMRIGSAFLVNQNGALSDRPDDTNLGSDFVMIWGDN